MIDYLNYIDTSLFYFINVSLQNPFFDWFMPFITEKYHWFPVWGVIIILLLWKGGKQGRIMVLLIIPVIFLSDQLAAHVFKPWIQRPRPCMALPDVHLLVNTKISPPLLTPEKMERILSNSIDCPIYFKDKSDDELIYGL